MAGAKIKHQVDGRREDRADEDKKNGIIININMVNHGLLSLRMWANVIGADFA